MKASLSITGFITLLGSTLLPVFYKSGHSIQCRSQGWALPAAGSYDTNLICSFHPIETSLFIIALTLLLSHILTHNTIRYDKFGSKFLVISCIIVTLLAIDFIALSFSIDIFKEKGFSYRPRIGFFVFLAGTAQVMVSWVFQRNN